MPSAHDDVYATVTEGNVADVLKLRKQLGSMPASFRDIRRLIDVLDETIGSVTGGVFSAWSTMDPASRDALKAFPDPNAAYVASRTKVAIPIAERILELLIHADRIAKARSTHAS